MKILYFAWVREKTGKAQEEVSIPESVNTVTALADWLTNRDEKFAEVFEQRSAVRVAVNQEYVSFDHAVSDNDEIAFFPPVTGG